MAKNKKKIIVTSVILLLIFIITGGTYYHKHFAFKKKIIDPTGINPSQAAALYNPVDNVIEGNSNGIMTMVIVFGYKCPNCRKMIPTEKRFIQNNSNKSLSELVVSNNHIKLAVEVS